MKYTGYDRLKYIEPNTKSAIFQVVASAVLSMSSEVKASRSRLEELLAKKEKADAERDLGEADNVHHQEMQIQRTQHQNHNNTHHYQDNGKGQGEETEDTQVGDN